MRGPHTTAREKPTQQRRPKYIKLQKEKEGTSDIYQWSAYVLQGNAISSCSVEAKFPFNQLSNVRHTQQFPKYVDISTWWISVASAALLTDLARSRNCFSSSLGTFILASVAALS